MKAVFFIGRIMIIALAAAFFAAELNYIPVAIADGGDGNPNIGYNAANSNKAKKKSEPKKTIKKTEKKAPEKKSTQKPKKKAAETTTVRAKKQPAPRKVEVAASGMPPATETRFIKNEVIVRFQLSSLQGERDRLIGRLGLAHLDGDTFFLPGVTVHRYRLPAGLGVREAISQLEADSSVVYAQPNYLYWLQQDQETQKLPQFGNDLIALGDAHGMTKGEGSRIAIIDTAVDASHSELSEADMISFDVSDLRVENVDPHGTSIAGILAADTKLTGVAPDATFIAIAAFSKSASDEVTGNTWTISDALNIALKEEADVLNLSFAGPADPLLENAFIGAKKRNILPVAAMGNEGPEAKTLYPAGYETVVAVTATNGDNEIYANANVGEHVDIAAPGVGLLVLSDNSGFRTTSGTSMATAYISGVAALALSANPSADYDTLRSLIENSASDLGEAGRDNIFGLGIPNAAQAASPKTN